MTHPTTPRPPAATATATTIRRRLARAVLPAALLLAAALPAAADSVWVASGTGNPVERPNVKVLKIEGGELFFESTQGVTKRPMGDVRQMSVTNEVPFNAAEAAFAKEDFKTAAENYRKALEVSRNPVVKVRATQRLAEAAGKSGDFLSAVAAWGQTVAGLDAASANRSKPPLPAEKKAAELNAAAGELERTLAAALSAEQKQVVQTYQVELYQAAGNTAKAEELIKRMNPAAAAAPGTGRAAPAGGGGASGDFVLVQVKQQMGGKNYAAAVDLIEKNRAAFATPENQAEALWNLATAKEALAGSDAAKLQEAAVAYMRVVAHFEGKPINSVNVPAALMRVGAIQEKLTKTDEAAQIYDSLTKDPKLKNTPIAQDAAKRLAEINKAKG